MIYVLKFDLFDVGIAAGAFVIVEMLYSSDLLALVGAGEQVCVLYQHFLLG